MKTIQWLYPHIFSCGTCKKNHIALAFDTFQTDACIDVLKQKEKEDKTAREILATFRENLHTWPNDIVREGLFMCEHCHKQHLGVSLENHEYLYLKKLAQNNGMTSVVKTLEEEPLSDYRDICDQHLEEAALHKHRCVIKIKSKRHSISIADDDCDWLQQFLEDAVSERRQWLNDADMEEEEYITWQIECVQQIMKKLEKGGTITLTDNQMLELGTMLHVERQVTMDCLKENDDIDIEYLNEQLEILNYFLHILKKKML
jgi:hypothetical protein